MEQWQLILCMTFCTEYEKYESNIWNMSMSVNVAKDSWFHYKALHLILWSQKQRNVLHYSNLNNNKTSVIFDSLV